MRNRRQKPKNQKTKSISNYYLQKPFKNKQKQK